MPEPKPKPWTIMVYMVARNEDDYEQVGKLYHAALDDIMEMANACDGEDAYVVVQLVAPIQFPDTRWRVRNLRAEQLPCPQDINPFARGTLRDFVHMCKREFPGDRYLLVFWGHGQGVTWKKASGGLLGGLTGWDDMTITELGKELKGLGIDKENLVVGFNTCVMGMLEAYFEIQDAVGCVIGGADEIPFTGWPYGEILDTITLAPDEPTRAKAKAIVLDVVQWYNRKSQAFRVTYAACDLTGKRCANLQLAIGGLTELLRESMKNKSSVVVKAIGDARRFAEDYREDAYIDLHAFCRRLEEILKGKEPAIEPAALAVADELEQFTIHHEISTAYSARYSRNSGGVAVCFPESRSWASSVLSGATVHRESYKVLAFSGATGWLDFVTEFHEANAALEAAGDAGPGSPAN